MEMEYEGDLLAQQEAMSWWDSAGLGSLVSQGLKHAQSKIDKVLDIKDGARSSAAGAAKKGPSYQPTTIPPTGSRSRTTSENDEFFQTWGFGVENQPEPLTKSASPKTPVSPLPSDISEEETSKSSALGLGQNFSSAKSAFSVVSKTFTATSHTEVIQEVHEDVHTEASATEEYVAEELAEEKQEQESAPETDFPNVPAGEEQEKSKANIESLPGESETSLDENYPEEKEEARDADYLDIAKSEDNIVNIPENESQNIENSMISEDISPQSQQATFKKSAPLKLISRVSKEMEDKEGKSLDSADSCDTLQGTEVSQENSDADVNQILDDINVVSHPECESNIIDSAEKSCTDATLGTSQEIKAESQVEEEKTEVNLEKSLSFEMTVTDEVSDGWEVSLDGDLLESVTVDDKLGEVEETRDQVTSHDAHSVDLVDKEESAQNSAEITGDPVPVAREDEDEDGTCNVTRDAEPVIDVVTENQQAGGSIDVEIKALHTDSVSGLNEEPAGPPDGAGIVLDSEQTSTTMTVSAGSVQSDMEMVESTEIPSGQEGAANNGPATDVPTPKESEDNLAVQPTVSTDLVDEQQSVDSIQEEQEEDSSSKLHVSFESSTCTDELSESNRTLTAEDFQQSSKSETEESKDSEQCNISKPHSDGAVEEGKPIPVAEEETQGQRETNLSSSSYVKNMLEEAMVESVKDAESHSCSSSERSSDMVRIESGLNSGHTSGDEIDTTTSSDIEIISTPTPNGEYRTDRPFDLSPLRHALSRGIRRSPPGHKRSDSGSSGQSTWSKNGDDLPSHDGHRQDDLLHDMQTEGGARPREQVKTGDRRREDRNNPLETEKLLKATIGENSHLTTIQESSEVRQCDPILLEKLADMAEVLEAREKKLVDMSRENMDLQEANSILRHQLQQMEEAREAEMTDVNKLTTEFTGRIGEAEKKIQAVLREKETLKKQLQRAEVEIMKKADNSAFELLLQEKEQQISELLEEGEKLSKQQLQTNNIVKKLRAKEKENETVLKTQKQKLEEQKKELEHLRKVCDAKEELEKKQSEAIHQLNGVVKKQEMEMNRFRSDLEDSHEKTRSMQVALDNSYKEIAELHKAKAARASEAQEAALSAEMTAKQEIQLQLERFQVLARQEQEALITQIEDMQLSLGRLEKEHNRREDILRQEISDLQQRLQEAEGRNQELTQGVTAATRPLLRQIENLQSTYTAQSTSFEKVEKNLTDRLAEAQTQLATAVERERAASETQLDNSARLAMLESQVSTLRQERSKLSAQLEMERTKVEVLEDAKSNDAAQLDALKGCYERELSEVKKDKIVMEHQLEIEKMKVESEKKKLLLAHEQIRDKEMQLQSRGSVSPTPSRDGSVTSDMSTSFTTISQEEVLEKTLMMSSSNGSLRSQSLYENLRQSGAANLLENLQAQLKQKEGEVQQLQSEIHELERTRESMARELVNLSNRLEELEEMAQAIPEYQRQHKELDTRYQALLQMYGEKVEETEELKLDLLDVKEMYKGQIEELLKA